MTEFNHSDSFNGFFSIIQVTSSWDQELVTRKFGYWKMGGDADGRSWFGSCHIGGVAWVCVPSCQ